MSQPNQPQGNTPPQQGQAQKKMVKIRMKPGKGRMLIGREWIKTDGTATKSRPKDPDDRENVNEEYLEARVQDDEGNWSDGPTATVSEDVIASFLKGSKDGLPHRFIDGYKMREDKGGISTDVAGFQRETAPNFSPGKERGVTDDCPFEILKSA
jgi:hypothetical protein